MGFWNGAFSLVVFFFAGVLLSLFGTYRIDKKNSVNEIIYSSIDYVGITLSYLFPFTKAEVEKLQPIYVRQQQNY